jgi:predicted amidohydrolase YtcJ
LVCFLSFSHGNIFALGTDADIQEEFKDAEFEQRIDATGKCIMPGE